MLRQLNPTPDVLEIRSYPLLRWALCLLVMLAWLGFTALIAPSLLYGKPSLQMKLAMWMTLGGIGLLPLGLMATSGIVVTRFDRRSRQANQATIRWWGIRSRPIPYEVSGYEVAGGLIRPQPGFWLVLHHPDGSGSGLHDELFLLRSTLDTCGKALIAFQAAPVSRRHGPQAPPLRTPGGLRLAGVSTVAALAIVSMLVLRVPPADMLIEAAQEGSLSTPEAMYSRGEAYFKGQGVDKDEEAGARWVIKAVEAGHRGGRLTLGDLYRGGMGVPQDPVMAHMYYTLGEEAGIERAARSRARLDRKLTPSQRAESATRLAEWKARHEKNPAR